jgi:hypothetical protein
VPAPVSHAANAYRLGLMGAQTRTEYEDAVKLGVVSDPYAAQRIYLEAHPADAAVSGVMATLNRALPFSSEAGAAQDQP